MSYFQTLLILAANAIALNAIVPAPAPAAPAPRQRLPQVKPATTAPAAAPAPIAAPVINAPAAKSPGTLEAGRAPMATPPVEPVLPGTRATITPAPRIPNVKPMADPAPGTPEVKPLSPAEISQQGATTPSASGTPASSPQPAKVKPPKDERRGFTRDADVDDYEKELLPVNPMEVRRQQLFFEANQFFKLYQMMTSLYDPSVLDMYASDARVIITTNGNSGRSTTQIVSKAELETALPISLPAARRRGAYDSFSDIQYQYQEPKEKPENSMTPPAALDRILITATRYVSPDRYRVPHSILVGRDEAGRWLILEEKVQVQQ